MIGKGDWNASGERWAVRYADCQSMVPDLTQAVDSMNKRKTGYVHWRVCEHQAEESGMFLHYSEQKHWLVVWIYTNGAKHQERDMNTFFDGF